ncbi:MAG: UDP-N-acetylglucosamine 2-epimerase (non-hydrolyzing) [Myxococcota bacterium]
MVPPQKGPRVTGRPAVGAVVGTRPEVIKMSPVLRALRTRRIEPRLAVVEQQEAILEAALEEARLTADVRVPVRSRSRVSAVVAGAVGPLEEWLAELRPELLLVHGDTSSALAGALAAFYQKIPIGHVEAGLRTGDDRSPFPEEMHRALIDRMASVLYAPTEDAAQALIAEGIPPGRVVVTGNPIVDAVAAERGPRPEPLRRTIVATAHRRESFGAPLRAICHALADVLAARSDIDLVYVLHPQPEAQRPAREILGGLPRVSLVPPMDHAAFLRLIGSAALVVTDSGGIQEEAPQLGVPAIVLREHTERREAVREGLAFLVGRDRATVVAAILDTLGRCLPRDERQLFGAPGAAARIADDVLDRLERPISIPRSLSHP